MKDGRESSGVNRERVSLAKDDMQLFAPMLVHADQLPINVRWEVPQHRVYRRMDMQGGRHQEEQRCGGANGQRLVFKVEEVSKLLKFTTLLVPLHTTPIIQPLKRKMDIFIGFELDHRESPGRGHGQ